MIEIKDVNVFKSSELRLENDLNRIRFANEHKAIIKDFHSSNNILENKQYPLAQSEKVMERDFER